MDLSPLANPLDEPILAGSTDSGLRVLVNHRPRRFGRSKFGASRFINGFLDLIAAFEESANDFRVGM